jgi:hypothetical protein
MNTNRRLAVAALAAAGLLWGTTVPLSKLALEWLPTGWLTAARFGLAAAVLLAGVRRTRPRLQAAARPRLRLAGRPASQAAHHGPPSRVIGRAVRGGFGDVGGREHRGELELVELARRQHGSRAA